MLKNYVEITRNRFSIVNSVSACQTTHFKPILSIFHYPSTNLKKLLNFDLQPFQGTHQPPRPFWRLLKAVNPHTNSPTLRSPIRLPDDLKKVPKGLQSFPNAARKVQPAHICGARLARPPIFDLLAPFVMHLDRALLAPFWHHLAAELAI